MLVSDVQWSDLVIYIPISVLFQILFPYRLWYGLLLTLVNVGTVPRSWWHYWCWHGLGTATPIELSLVGLAYLGTCVRGERLAALGHSWALYTHDSHQAPPRTSSSIMRNQCQWGCLDTLTAPTLHLEASKPRLEILWESSRVVHWTYGPFHSHSLFWSSNSSGLESETSEPSHVAVTRRCS